MEEAYLPQGYLIRIAPLSQAVNEISNLNVTTKGGHHETDPFRCNRTQRFKPHVATRARPARMILCSCRRP